MEQKKNTINNPEIGMVLIEDPKYTEAKKEAEEQAAIEQKKKALEAGCACGCLTIFAVMTTLYLCTKLSKPTENREPKNDPIAEVGKVNTKQPIMTQGKLTNMLYRAHREMAQ